MTELRRPAILNVDDRADVRYLRSRVLRQAGYDVREASGGREALDLVAADRPDIVLLDVRLPDMNGLEVCRRIKADPATASVLVLQISAILTGGRDRVDGLESGADAYLVAPVEPDELIATVRALLRVRHAEDQLCQNAELFRSLFDSAAVLLVGADRDGRIVLFNPACEALTGYRRDEVLGQPLLPILVPERWRSRVAARFGDFSPDALATPHLNPWATRSGAERLIEWRCFRSAAATGEPLVFGVGRDVTEEQRGADRQAAQAAVMRLLTEAESIDEAVPRVLELLCETLGWERGEAWWVDPATALLAAGSWHPSALERTALQAPPVALAVSVRSTGKPRWVVDLLDEPELARKEALVRAGLRAAFAFPVSGRAGVIGVLALFAARPREPDEALVAMLSVIGQQIGLFVERKRAEGDRERLLAEAEAAARAMDQFLATLGHELRNPLAPIVHALQVLDQIGAQAPEAIRLRQIIGRQTRHLARLVDDLLDMARVRSGKLAIRRMPVDLRTVAERAVESLEAVRTEQLHHVALVADSGPVVVEGDPVRLEQIVANLLDNAVKYSPNGGPIRVVVRREDGQAAIRVHDPGVGIAPEQLARIFEPFAQLDTAPDRPRGGLGLGLAVVRALARHHGGTVAASSPGPGLGSEFVVRLPLSTSPPGRTGESDPTPAVPSCRVVVVEDYADARDALETLLTLEGHQVRTAADGQQGLELILASRPDVALVDIGLPGLDGYEVAARVRATPEGRSLYLVALTGYGQRPDIERARAAGFDAHLVKPVDPDQLGRVFAGLGRRPDTAGPTAPDG